MYFFDLLVMKNNSKSHDIEIIAKRSMMKSSLKLPSNSYHNIFNIFDPSYQLDNSRGRSIHNYVPSDSNLIINHSIDANILSKLMLICEDEKSFALNLRGNFQL